MQLVSKNVAANRMGVSVRTLERLAREGAGPARLHVGKRVLFREDALAAWIDARS